MTELIDEKEREDLKKNGWGTMVIALILALCCICAACAEVIPPQEPGQQIGYQAVVLCETLTLREKASASSKAIRTLHYGDLPIVIGADLPSGAKTQNGFVYCTLGETEDSPSGWLNEEYLFINPSWYVTKKQKAVYAWNDAKAPKVALLEKNERLPILKEEDLWYLISLRGAVGWILK